MNANKRRALAAQLVNVAARLKDADTIPGSAKFIGVLVGEKHFGLAGEDADAIEEMSSTFLQQSGWVERYSETHIGNLLRTLLGNLYGNNTPARAEQLLADLDAGYQAYQKKHTVQAGTATRDGRR